MQLSAKEYEFLGRQVEKGKYVSKGVCILCVLLALVAGLFGGYVLNNGSSNGETRRRLVAQGDSNQVSSDVSRNNKLEFIAHQETEAQKNPKDKNVWIELGNAYYDLQDFAKAVNAYNKALEIDQNMPDVLVDCGVAYRLNKKPDTAIAYFDRALKVKPNHEFAQFNKGVVFLNDLKKEREALDIWRGLVKNSPQFKVPDGRLLSDILKAYE